MFKARTAFSRLNTGIVVSNPCRGMNVRLHLFCVYVVLCRYRPCDRVDHTSEESYRLSIRSIVFRLRPAYSLQGRKRTVHFYCEDSLMLGFCASYATQSSRIYVRYNFSFLYCATWEWDSR
jgi:hypothetical protein